MSAYRLHDVVTLAVDIPEQDITKGAIGTIVEEFTIPSVAYEVEFSDEDGCAIAQLALVPEQIAPYRQKSTDTKKTDEPSFIAEATAIRQTGQKANRGDT